MTTTLSTRQREILICRCAKGLTQADTAAELGITSKVIGRHIAKACANLCVHGIEEACFHLGLRARELMEDQAT